MVKLGMVGKVLIHNYPYGAYFNGVDDDVLRERCTKAWMQPLIEGRFAEPAAKEARITHVWAGVRDEAEAIAASCRIETVCDTCDDVLEAVDGMLILDEDIAFRTETAERCLRAGKSIFVDKTLSLSVDRTGELVALAGEQNVHVAAWSQLLFAAEAAPFRAFQGGAAVVTFNLAKDNVPGYGIHLVSSAMAAFGADPVGMTRVAGDAPAVAFTYADGKTVLLRAGSDVPARGFVSYVGKEQGSVTAALEDMAAMFDGSAAALAAMFEDGTPPIPPEAVVRMAEAAALLCD